MLDPDLVGRTFEGTALTEVTQSSIESFCAAISEIATHSAPPTYAITITLAQSQNLLQDSGLDWTRVVHGDQKFKIVRPIVAGDVLRCASTIESARVVAGNEIVSVRTDVYDTVNELVVSTWSTLVVRA